MRYPLKGEINIDEWYIVKFADGDYVFAIFRKILLFVWF